MGCSKNKMLMFLKSIIFNITIEPMLFLYYTARTTVSVIKEDLKLERFCLVTLNHTTDECSHLIENDEIQIEVQTLDNDFILFERIVGMVIPVIFLIFVATWSDKHGRRVPIIAPMAGFTIWCIIYFLEALFPSWPPEILLVAAFLESCGGGFMTFLMGYYSHMVDITSEKTRTTRLGIVMAVKSLGIPTGQVLGPVLNEAGGYLLVFGSTAGMSIICIIYAFLMVQPKFQNKIIDESTSSSFCENISTFCNVLKNNLIQFIGATYKKRPGNDRVCINVLLFGMMLGNSTQPHKMYLWSQRVLKWDSNQFSLYMTTSELIGQLVMIVFSMIVKLGKVHDCYIGSAVTLLLWCKLLSLGLTTRPDQWWILYMFLLSPDAFGTMTIRSLISKISGKEDCGRVFSLLGIMETIWGVVDSGMYTAIYDATIAYYPSAEHLFSAMLSCILFAIFLWVKWAKDWESEEQQEQFSHKKILNDTEEREITSMEFKIECIEIEEKVTNANQSNTANEQSMQDISEDQSNQHPISDEQINHVINEGPINNHTIANSHLNHLAFTEGQLNHHVITDEFINQYHITDNQADYFDITDEHSNSDAIVQSEPAEGFCSNIIPVDKNSSTDGSNTNEVMQEENEIYQYSDVD